MAQISAHENRSALVEAFESVLAAKQMTDRFERPALWLSLAANHARWELPPDRFARPTRGKKSAIADFPERSNPIREWCQPLCQTHLGLHRACYRRDLAFLCGSGLRRA